MTSTEFPEPSTPYVTDEADILHDVRDQLNRIESLLTTVVERMDSTEKAIQGIIAEVKPTIDELLNSGLGKMLGIGKKK